MIYFCAQKNRRTLVLARPPLNGIDYLEIADATDQSVLLVTFLRPGAAGTDAANRSSSTAARASPTSTCWRSASVRRCRTRCAVTVDRGR